MKMAYQEAIHSIGLSDPNPAVGAVLVKNGEVLSTGSTMPVGFEHAEVVAIEKAWEKYGHNITRGATLYVTLEPCTHHGRTPPCVDKITESGIARIYIDQVDPSKKVDGRGIKILRENNIDCIVENDSSFETERLFTLMPFLKQQKTGLPLCILKWAQTKEGWLAPHEGPSGSISSQDSMEVIHRLRHLFRASLATPGTVAIDRPRMNVRASLNTLNSLEKEEPSVFLKTILRYEEEQNWAYLRETKEKTRKNRTQDSPLKNYRYFMLPPLWEEKEIHHLYAQQIKLDNQFHFITYSEVQSSQMISKKIPHDLLCRKTLFIDSLKTIGKHKHNQVMIEAGPKASQSLIDLKLPDILICMRSKRNASFQDGLGFSLSEVLSFEDHLDQHGYANITKLNSSGDMILVFFAKHNFCW